MNKRAVNDIAKVLVCLISIFVAGQNASANADAAASACPEIPSYIYIDYRFDWSPAEQRRLMDDFQLKCGLRSDVEWLVTRTEFALKTLGHNVTNRSLSLKPEFGQAIVKLETDKDDDQPRSALFPVNYFEFDKNIFGHAEITGVVREDETLVLRYVLDETRIRDPNSRIAVQWLRNGQQIEGANKSRYKLTSEDVGGKVTALISLLDSRNIAYAQRKITVGNKVGRVISLPEVRDLKIEGEAIIGKVVKASYVYADRNRTDKEQNSRFVWMRDGFLIKEASGPAYQIVPQDAGKRISVRVTPQNIRNEIGITVVAEMEQIVEDELLTLRPVILAGTPNDSRETISFEPLQVTKEVFSDLDEAKSITNCSSASKKSIFLILLLTSQISIHAI